MKIKNDHWNRPPDPQLIQEVLKENYDFGFATVGHEVYDEDELEAALTENVTNLLIEMGNGFAFLGKQREIIVGGRSRKIDLLFYHIRLRCYVVCDLLCCAQHNRSYVAQPIMLASNPNSLCA